MNDELDPREAARMRRRDRDADAQARALLRPGMGKVFKQILDTQARAVKRTAREPSASPPKRASKKTSRPSTDTSPDDGA
jgi:hypothetical protein